MILLGMYVFTCTYNHDKYYTYYNSNCKMTRILDLKMSVAPIAYFTV